MIFNAYSDQKQDLFGLSVISSGHIFAHNGRKISRPLGREDFLLFYIAKGSEHFFLDTDADANAGDFIFFRPHEKQEHICLYDGTAEFYFIHFSAAANFDLFGFESFKIYTATPCAAVCDLFEDIIDELQKKKPAYEKICIAKLINLAALLERNTTSENHPQNRYINAISYAVQTMNRSYAENRSLEDYAALCNMSKFHFLRVFKSITGISPLEYRSKIRIEHAKNFLEDSHMSVSEIAARVGFSSAAYFCDAFKRKTGLSPLQYRQKLQ